MCCAFFNGPVFHCICNNCSNRSVKFFSAFNSFHQLFVSFLRQASFHNRFIKNVFAKNWCNFVHLFFLQNIRFKTKMPQRFLERPPKKIAAPLPLWNKLQPMILNRRLSINDCPSPIVSFVYGFNIMPTRLRMTHKKQKGRRNTIPATSLPFVTFVILLTKKNVKIFS